MSDFVIAYTLHGSVILAIEVTMLLVVTFGIFGVCICYFIAYLLLTIYL